MERCSDEVAMVMKYERLGGEGSAEVEGEFGG
jgi:hypothetical protein